MNSTELRKAHKDLFNSTIRAIGYAGASEQQMAAFEALASKSSGQNAAVIDAALSFCYGFDLIAVKTLVDANIHGAERLVRRMRIEVADDPKRFCLPRLGDF